MGDPMTEASSPTPADSPLSPIAASTAGVPAHHEHLQDAARRHLWMHFTRMSSYAEHDVPVIVRGEGPWVWDSRGRRYLDGLSGLFVVLAGHGRRELAEAAARQAGELAYFPLWSYAHPSACCGAFCPGRCLTPASSAEPTTAAIRWCSWHHRSSASRSTSI